MNWCPTWICKIICFFIGHKWTDWWIIVKNKYTKKIYLIKGATRQYVIGEIRFCERCAKCEEANPELK